VVFVVVIDGIVVVDCYVCVVDTALLFGISIIGDEYSIVGVVDVGVVVVLVVPIVTHCWCYYLLLLFLLLLFCPTLMV
jgi:hypothetical protein